ncbi:MAG: hypothetical protein II702_07045 [Clostridia bacterium]|nr:hypothetical protein [Clostridia bacterium]
MFNKKIKRIIAFILILSSLFMFASCSSKKESDESLVDGITINGVIADNNGVSAEGLNLVMINEETNEDYTVKIGKNGGFQTVIPIDTSVVLTVEGDNGAGLTQPSHFIINKGNATVLGPMNGNNYKGNLNVFATEETKELYLTFYLDENNYLSIRYLSESEPEPVTSAQQTEIETTSNSDVMF